MEISLEMVERLKEKADVSYSQAKEALEYSGGNLLDALIYLEEKGVIPRAEGAYYSTRSETPPPPAEPLPVRLPVTSLPVLILALLLCCAPWVTIPVLIMLLFLGFRYRFSGPDLERDDLNSMMGSVADSASDLGHKVMEELKHDWHSDEKK